MCRVPVQTFVYNREPVPSTNNVGNKKDKEKDSKDKKDKDKGHGNKDNKGHKDKDKKNRLLRA